MERSFRLGIPARGVWLGMNLLLELERVFHTGFAGVLDMGAGVGLPENVPGLSEERMCRG